MWVHIHIYTHTYAHMHMYVGLSHSGQSKKYQMPHHLSMQNHAHTHSVYTCVFKIYIRVYKRVQLSVHLYKNSTKCTTVDEYVECKKKLILVLLLKTMLYTHY